MVQYELSEKAKTLLSEGEIECKFEDDQTISIVLRLENGSQALLRNWVDPDVINFEAYYSLPLSIMGYAPEEQNRASYYHWKQSHDFFTEDPEYFWNSGKYNKKRYGNKI